MPLEDLTQGLQDTFQQYWKPGLAGAALGGTAAGYLSRDTGEPNEAPSVRRKRMLRNALIGALMGGTAGVGIPAGAAVVSEPWGDAKALTGGPVDAALGFAGAHAVPATIGAMGAGMIHKTMRSNRAGALTDLADTLINEADGRIGNTDLGSKTDDVAKGLRAFVGLDPKRIDTLHETLSAVPREESMSRLFGFLKTHAPDTFLSHKIVDDASLVSAMKGSLGKSLLERFQNNPKVISELTHALETSDPLRSLRMQELLSEAGLKPTVEKSIGHNLANLFTRAGTGPLVDNPKVLEHYLKTEGGVASRIMSKLVGAKRIPVTTGKATFNPEVIPEIWRQLVRPSIKGRIPTVGKLGLLGGAVMAGQNIQDRLTGN